MANFTFYNNQLVFQSNNRVCQTSKELIETKLFKELTEKYLKNKQPPLLNIEHKQLIKLLTLLTEHPKETIIKNNPELASFFSNQHLLKRFITEFYNYWRNFERFFIYHSNNNSESPPHTKPYRTFNNTIEHLNHLARKTYRDITENITNTHPRIYRQIPSAFQVGIITSTQTQNHPYTELKEIPFIKQILLEPPLILNPPMNKRTGTFQKIDTNPLENIEINPADWLCYPAKVGELIIHIYFHNKFINLGSSLANLFKLAYKEDLEKKPDAIYLFGIKNKFDQPVFFEDKENNILLATAPEKEEFGYFGYLKKMTLTLHNTIMIKRGKLPIHGAMVNISLKNNKTANIILIGDTGTGKSELLEAFRILAKEYIKDITIIFDDMGSLSLEENKIKAYGTEIGAFVRLDDLHPGFAFGNIDRSIIMSPEKTNSRAIIPITTYENITKGFSPDYILYANNYENTTPIYEQIDSPEKAIEIFKKATRLAKGTTTETGLVNSYFANIFGPIQNKDLHDKLAERFFQEFFSQKIKVAQLRTKLGIKGYEKKGPEQAAKELFKIISEN